MVLYIINIIFIMLYGFFYHATQKKYNTKKKFIIIVTLQLILILALREHTVGIDTKGYLKYFVNLTPNYNFQQFFDHRFEFGYKLINKLISLFTLNEQLFLTIMATISVIPVSRFIYKYSKMPFLSFGLYVAFNFYSFTFSGLRQAIAFGVILISYDYVVNRKIKSFILCVLLASMFHQTAVIFLPAYFLSEVKINKKSISIILIFNLILYAIKNQMFELVIKYVFDSYDIIETGSKNWMMLGVLIVSLSLLFYKRVMEQDNTKNSIYMFVIVGVSLMLFSTMGTNVMRMANYYYLFIIILIPEVLSSIKDKILFLTGGYIIIIGIFVLHTWFLLCQDTYHIVPYAFFW